MGWKKVEVKTKDGWLNISYQDIPDHIPKEQHAKYIKMKNAEYEKYGSLTVQEFGCFIENGGGSINVTEVNL